MIYVKCETSKVKRKKQPVLHFTFDVSLALNADYN